MFDFSIVTNWIDATLRSVMPDGAAIFVECVLVALCIISLYAILAIVLIYMERLRILPVPPGSQPCR